MRKICGAKVDCFLFSSSQKDNRALKTIRSGRFIKSRVYEEAVRISSSRGKLL